MEKELVSIIVPVYNTESYLTECLSSIGNQTYTKIEIILVDDGSTDNSLRICNEFAAQRNNVFVIHQDNCGSGAARNAGIDRAQGQYLAFIDSDDYICPNEIETMVSAMKHKECSVACVGLKFVETERFSKLTEQEQTSPVVKIFSSREYITDLLSQKEHCSVDNKMYRADEVRKNNIHFQTIHQYWEDMIFNLDYLDATDGKVYCFNADLYHVRIRENSQTTLRDRGMNEELVHSTKHLWKHVLSRYGTVHVNTVATSNIYANAMLVFFFLGGTYKGKTRKETAREINKEMKKLPCSLSVGKTVLRKLLESNIPLSRLVSSCITRFKR